MICRRCGMESATTDVCEWCKKPMLPEGGSISAKAKEQLLEERAQAEKQGPPPEAEPEPPKPAAEGEMAPARPGLKPPSQPEVHESGLLALGANIGNEAAEATPPSFVTREVEGDDSPLRPLGPAITSQGDGSGDLSAETSRYIGNDQNIFRPIERPQSQQGGGGWVIDPTTGRRKRVTQEKEVVPDNIRLRRAAPYGAAVAVVVTLAQFFIAHTVPASIATVRFPGLTSTSDPSIANAFIYAVYLSILLGFMMAAILVQFKKGPGVGLLIGVVIGFGALQNGYWGFAAGVLAGILVGRITGKGIRTVVSV